MALASTIYRIEMDLSDIDRGVYETLDFRVAQHPSEGGERLVTRVLAYALLFEENLEFGKGLSAAEEPALWTHDLTGRLMHWVDVGSPGADRIHIASKKSARVSIVCHHGLEGLRREMKKRSVHRADEIKVILLEPDFVSRIAAVINRKSKWTLMRNEESLIVSVDEQNFSGTIKEVALPQ